MRSADLRAMYEKIRTTILRHLTDDELSWELRAIHGEFVRRAAGVRDDAIAGADDDLARAALEARERAADVAREIHMRITNLSDAPNHVRVTFPSSGA